MKDKIKVLRKVPNSIPVITEIANELEVLQDEVGGYIEVVTLTPDLAVICNEEGRLYGLRDNCTIFGVNFVGTILLVGVDGEHFTDLPLNENQMRKLFPRLYGQGDML